MQRSLEIAAMMAPSQSPILVLGETGTGKELFARYIHKLSGRQDKFFIAVNCAAIPADLVESILFGHKRGAFTGAVSDQTGKFDMADKGTLFLDEVGDLPSQAQAKLLRVLQDGFDPDKITGGGRPETPERNDIPDLLNQWKIYKSSKFSNPPGVEAGTLLPAGSAETRCWWANIK
jgi:hypothetical protein